MVEPAKASNPRRAFYRRPMIKMGLILGIAVLVFAARTVYIAGELKSIQPHFVGSTQAIEGLVGGEDITMDHSQAIAFVSADDRYGRASGRPGAHGAIYAWDFQDRLARPREMTRQPHDPIAPHGISWVQGSDGFKYLYVVDHLPDPATNAPVHRILLYRIHGSDQLELVRTFADSQFLNSPNDVLGVDEHRFYFTNDHGSSSPMGRMLEEYLQRKISNVVYFDGSEYRTVAGGIAMANGINMSSDGSQVYVAATLGRKMLVYDRQLDTGDLQLRKEIFLNTGVDNIERDQAGNLWIGCHPKLLTFVRHSRDTSRLSPSQVLKLSPQGDGDFSVQEVFLDDGRLISGSAVAAVSGDILLIGPVLDKKLLRCEMTAPN